MTEPEASQEPPKPILEEPLSKELLMSNSLLQSISRHIDIANQSYIDLENIKFKTMSDMIKDKKFVDDVWKDCDVYREVEFCIAQRALYRGSGDIINYQRMQIKVLIEKINEIVREIKRVPVKAVAVK